MSEKPDSGELDIANVIKLPLQDITYEVKCMLIKKRLPHNCEKVQNFSEKVRKETLSKSLRMLEIVFSTI